MSGGWSPQEWHECTDEKDKRAGLLSCSLSQEETARTCPFVEEGENPFQNQQGWHTDDRALPRFLNCGKQMSTRISCLGPTV